VGDRGSMARCPCGPLRLVDQELAKPGMVRAAIGRLWHLDRACVVS
jgi:hypothetical protein